MIGVVMGQKNMTERPTALGQRCHNGGGFWHIDHQRFAGVSVMGDVGIIICQTRDR